MKKTVSKVMESKLGLVINKCLQIAGINNRIELIVFVAIIIALTPVPFPTTTPVALAWGFVKKLVAKVAATKMTTRI